MPRITFLQINDLHGYVAPHPELVRDPDGRWRFACLGGLARIAGLFAAARAENPGGVVALDNGDTFHGTHLAVASRGMALVPPMNALGLDGMTLHWEFAHTPEGVRAIGAALAHPMLAINVRDARDDRLFAEPYVMLERHGLRVAVIGIASPIVDKTMPESFGTGLRFTDGRAELPRWIARAREVGADLVAVLSHLGFPQDVRLAQEVDGIDVLLGGHTHNRLDRAVEVNGALLLQSGCHGSFVGRLDLRVEDGRIAGHDHRLIPVDDSAPEEPGMARLVDAALAGERERMAEVVGEAAVPLHRYAMLGAPMDDVLLEAIARAAGTGIAVSNGWRYGAPVPPGPVTLGDLWAIIPTNPPVSVVEMTGAELREMLEDNLRRTFAADPFEQMGGYLKRLRGLTMYVKVENPDGQRIDRLYAEGRRVDPERLYRVAFVTEQGVPRGFGRNRRDLDIRAVDALRRLFEEQSPVQPSEEPTVLLV